MPDSAIRVEGLDELRRKIGSLAGSVQRPAVRQLFVVGARDIRDAAKKNAPRGKHPTYTNFKTKVTWEPGTLKRAITAYPGKGRSLPPAAFARVNVFKGRDRAPHAHLVEFGTKERRPKSQRFMVFLAGARKINSRVGRRWIYARRVKAMPANPFFQKAVAARSTPVLNKIVEGLQAEIEKAAKQQGSPTV